MPCIFYWLYIKIHYIFTLPTHVAETDISKKNNEKLYASDWTQWHTPISAAWEDDRGQLYVQDISGLEQT